MADMTAPTGQAPTMAPLVRTDDQILPRIRAFTASSTIPSIYIQKFWVTIQYDKTAGCFRKKMATLIVIPSIRFTKLIIHHLQRRHRFHPRPDSPLHLPNEEPVLGYLKFSAKGTKREVFGMPIPGRLITAEIREASYYQEYLAKVAQYRRKPKSKTTKAPPRPAVTSTQPAPTSAPAKPQAKKHKQATETSEKPPKAKKSKYGWVSKKRTLKNVEASKAKEVPAMEPQVATADTDLQKDLEESMKTAYDLPRGPLSPVVIREPEPGNYQPLLEVPGKGKAKVTEEQVAHDQLSLQKHKKTSPAEGIVISQSHRRKDGRIDAKDC
nr:hypothetical protein [Tanacetum cinerariifolium]